MDGWLIYGAAIVLAAALLALGRGWWFGLPGSVVVALAFFLTFFSVEYAAVAGLLVAIISGAKLPAKDRLAAILIGPSLSVIFFVILAAPDSPVNFIAAGCTGSFAVGALIGWGVAAVRARGHNQVEA